MQFDSTRGIDDVVNSGTCKVRVSTERQPLMLRSGGAAVDPMTTVKFVTEREPLMEVALVRITTELLPEEIKG